MLGGGVMKGPLCWRKLYRNGPFSPGRPATGAPPPQDHDTPRPFKQGATGTTGGGGPGLDLGSGLDVLGFSSFVSVVVQPPEEDALRGPPGPPRTDALSALPRRR